MSSRAIRTTRRGAPRSLSAIGAALVRDPYVFYTATLVPVVLAVAVANQDPEADLLALVAGALAITAQLVLGRVLGRGARGHRVVVSLVRLAIPVLFVAVSVELVGGESRPLLALYAPVVAGAAAVGAVQGWTIAGVAAAMYLLPQFDELNSAAGVGLRGIALAGVAIVLAYGTRRITVALRSVGEQARVAVRAERSRSRQIADLDALGPVLAGGATTDDVLDQVAREASRRFSYPYVTLYLGDGAHMRLVANVGYPEALPSFDARTGVAGRVMRTGELALVPDVGDDPDYVTGTVAATSLICAPMVADGQLLGLLNIETVGERRLEATDARIVRILASKIATAVALTRERERLAARVDLLRRIERFGRDVSSSLEIGATAEVIVEALGDVVPANTLAVTLLDRADGRYRVAAVRGVPDEAIGREIRSGEGLAGRAMRDRAMVIDDTLTPEKYPSSVRGLALAPLTRGAAIPLIRDGVVVGAFTIGRTAEGADFSELELEGLQLLAGGAALAVGNAFLHAEVAELAVRDGLTGLYNRRHFDDAFDRLLAGNRRQRLSGHRPLSAIVFDLDRFGAFNKQHGHQVGDRVLRAFADVLRGRFRESDLVARLGGEEFVAVLDGATRDHAAEIAEDVRERIAARRIRTDDGSEVQVTVSAGCAELDPADPTRESLLRAADVALFMAKRAGRDRVVAA